MANRTPDLEGALLLVGQELEYPPAADLAPLVRAAYESRTLPKRNAAACRPDSRQPSISTKPPGAMT